MITILDVMGDFTDIKSLVAMTRCSKQAKQLLTPLIEKKVQNAHEMRQAVLQTFPLIKELPAVDPDHGAEYFKGLLTHYFTAPARPKVQISYRVGCLLAILSFEPNDRDIHRFVRSEVQTSLGRKRILESIRDWRQGGELDGRNSLQRLQKLEDLTRNNFAVNYDDIELLPW